jgi:hypothetical protein
MPNKYVNIMIYVCLMQQIKKKKKKKVNVVYTV